MTSQQKTKVVPTKADGREFPELRYIPAGLGARRIDGIWQMVYLTPPENIDLPGKDIAKPEILTPVEAEESQENGRKSEEASDPQEEEDELPLPYRKLLSDAIRDKGNSLHFLREAHGVVKALGPPGLKRTWAWLALKLDTIEKYRLHKIAHSIALRLHNNHPAEFGAYMEGVSTMFEYLSAISEAVDTLQRTSTTLQTYIELSGNAQKRCSNEMEKFASQVSNFSTQMAILNSALERLCTESR